MRNVLIVFFFINTVSGMAQNESRNKMIFLKADYGQIYSSQFSYHQVGIQIGYGWSSKIHTSLGVSGLSDSRNYDEALTSEYIRRHNLLNINVTAEYIPLDKFKIKPVVGVEIGTGMISNAKDGFVNTNISKKESFYNGSIFNSVLFNTSGNFQFKYTTNRIDIFAGVKYELLIFDVNSIDVIFNPVEDYFEIGDPIKLLNHGVGFEIGINYWFQPNESDK